MDKIKVFVSSVQKEFKSERAALRAYILSDPLLGTFFEPFLFESLPASSRTPKSVYLQEVEESPIYLGLLGVQYGFEDHGVSATEREFDHAVLHHKTRLVFVTSHSSKERDPKQRAFIRKAQSGVVRRRFSGIEELKAGIYSALVNYLKESGKIQVKPFDEAVHPSATLADIDPEKVIDFVRTAHARRGFSLAESAPVADVLTHLNLLSNGDLTHAALLLFGKQPQRFFITSEVRCAYYHGTEVVKPIPSYKVFKGDVFELVDQSIDFVLSKLDFSIGTRATDTSIPGKYELPKEMVAEAIVNAIAHRDYTGNGSVQVMLFKDRLEIYNPGTLPMGWTIEKLMTVHTSVPQNPLLADAMYLKGYIERLGTGTADILRIAKEEGLPEPAFIQDDAFRVVLYRPTATVVTGDATVEVTGEVIGDAAEEVLKVVLALDGEMKRSAIQAIVGLKHDDHFRTHYITPALEGGYIQMKFPTNIRHPRQKYLLTEKGILLKKATNS